MRRKIRIGPGRTENLFQTEKSRLTGDPQNIDTPVTDGGGGGDNGFLIVHVMNSLPVNPISG
jgi:hypothetical protein